MKKLTMSEAHYESLLTSMRYVRNRLIFFALFLVYSLLSILSTTDKMLYMKTAIKMPLLNLDLPLIPFYIVMPFFYRYYSLTYFMR